MVSQILLFDTPRSACQLLERILSKQTRGESLHNPHSTCRGQQVEWLTSQDWANGMSNAAHGEFEMAAQEGVRKWQQALERAAIDDKILLINDHPFSSGNPYVVLHFVTSHIRKGGAPFELQPQNFTSIPSSLLLHPGTIPILTIRHPILTVSSTYRVLDDFGLPNGSGRSNFLLTTNPIWIKMLYLFFKDNGVQPIIADADDFMTSREYVRVLAKKVGLNSEELVFEWDLPTEEERKKIHPMLYKSQKKLIESTGVRADRAGVNLDLNKEREEWVLEFGVEGKMLVEEMIELAMPHYKWLWERRFKVEE